MSDTLRHALARARLGTVDVAAALEVDPKTVDRWLKGRVPYPRHRWALADMLQLDEGDLWPDVAQPRRTISREVKAVYPHRWAVPQAIWRRLFQSASREIDILTYSSLFLAEDTGMIRLLASRAEVGVKIRILLGDPDSPEVATRGAEEGIGADVIAARVHNALMLYRPLQDVDGVEIRLHRTTLYNSIYRADTELLVNVHAYGTPAAQAPVLYLTATKDEDSTAIYLTSLERVWATAESLR
ncbi:XRE family transcriptional regulator [Microbispora hainanensis]|uniref:XRE family transcriptional regulator n=1 Tax=Microbispora hainanensis TaxID=568844 RepID=A0ABZ1SJA4_9ACTN|nr:XRE family transcriptional regulator [Microbispora hainanensis]